MAPDLAALEAPPSARLVCSRLRPRRPRLPPSRTVPRDRAVPLWLSTRRCPSRPLRAPALASAVAMTAAVFFGCAFIAFGPALALYVFTIATEPLRIIFLIAGAFFWLVSLLISSLFWFLARLITDNKDGPMQKYLLIFGVLLSIFIQEMFRFAYYRLLKKASEGLKSINPDETAPSMRLLAYVSGLGFGIMSGVFSFVNTLSNSLGPGTVGIHGDSPQFFLNSAFMTLVVILLHVFWGIVFFDACEKKKWYVLLIVLLTHLLVSAQTFLNPHYGINLVSAYIIMVVMGIWAFFVAGGSCRSLKLCLLCQDKDFLLYNQRSR